MQAITDKQIRVMRVVGEMERRGEAGLVPGLVGELGLAGESSLTPTLRILEREGMVVVGGGGSKGRPRVVRLTPLGRRMVGGRGVPLWGEIPAGPMSEAVPEAVLEEAELLRVRSGDFLLRVRGDSMVGDGILDGDKVLLRPGVTVNSGEIAAVQVGVGHEATLKRVIFAPESGEVILRASNPVYADVRVPVEDVVVAGVFRGLIRNVD